MANSIYSALEEWGHWLCDTSTAIDLAQKAKAKNPWFLEQFVFEMLQGITDGYLQESKLKPWAENYTWGKTSKNIGIVCAGNIPAVGFHDLLSLLVSPHRAILKLSSKDDVILPAIWQKWIELWPDHVGKITFTDRLNKVDALIATGSDEMKKHFEFYFKETPKIVRGHRNGVAILTGSETEEELLRLGNDIFLYFGLGCRNVSWVCAPRNMDWTVPLSLWEKQFEFLTQSQKYMNNFDYNKTILLLNKVPHLSSMNLNVVENESLHSRIGNLHWSSYRSSNMVEEQLNQRVDGIQCVVGNKDAWSINNVLPFGHAQCPGLTDYADGVDTLMFLSELSREDD